jgi:hypothetical protein
MFARVQNGEPVLDTDARLLATIADKVSLHATMSIHEFGADALANWVIWLAGPDGLSPERVSNGADTDAIVDAVISILGSPSQATSS